MKYIKLLTFACSILLLNALNTELILAQDSTDIETNEIIDKKTENNDPDKIKNNQTEAKTDKKPKTVKTTKSTTKSESNKNGVFELYYSKGITYPYGEISGDGGQASLIANSETTGINAGYILAEKHYIFLGYSYTEMLVEFEREYMSQPLLTSVEIKYMNIELSYRFKYNNFFFGSGLYYSFVFGNWERENSLDGNTTNNKLYAQYEDAAKDTLGLSLLAGYIYHINDNCSAVTSLRTTIPFLPVYESDDDSIYVMDIAICAAFSYNFSFPFLD